MINLEETYALPSKKMFNVLWDNERNEERFERSKNKITKLISDQNLNGNDKFKLFKSFKKAKPLHTVRCHHADKAIVLATRALHRRQTSEHPQGRNRAAGTSP